MKSGDAGKATCHTNSLLAHGIRANRSGNKVRIAQYIFDDARRRRINVASWRISSWKIARAPEGYASSGDPSMEQTNTNRRPFSLGKNWAWMRVSG